MKVIFHIDNDSYFVSAARTVQPELIGKPVAITDMSRRSIIAAASYEAKAKGVYVPMPFYKAVELVPDLIPVHPDFALYTVLSTKLFELLSNEITTNIEVASIDECFMDVTDIYHKWGSPAKLAKHIQDLVMKELKLPVSIGIGSNKFVAKMSTSINKPFGITVTKPGDFEKTFKNNPTSDIYGVGGPTGLVLAQAGIRTIGDLINAPKEDIINILGARGYDIWANVHELGTDEINLEMNDLKGIGNSITFMDRDRNNREEILEILKHLCNTVSLRLTNRNFAGKVVSVAIKEKGGLEVKAKRRQETLTRPVSTRDEIFEAAMKIFDDLWDESTLKFIGVHVTKLSDVFDNTYQQSLFDEKNEKTKIDDIMHNINAKLGNKSVVSLREASMNIKKEQNQSRYLEADRVKKKYKK